MENSKYITNLKNLPLQKINHGSAEKKVFVHFPNTDSGLTQFAYSKFSPGDICNSHIHNTMEEYFFVHAGSGTYCIGNENLEICKGDFIRIPANTPHHLSNDSNEDLELIYFGIAQSDKF